MFIKLFHDWDLFGKNVAAFHGQVKWLDDVRKQFKEETQV